MSEERVKMDRGTEMRVGLLKWLDLGSDPINVRYRYGHGSKYSVGVTVIFLVGFMAFLYYFGVMQFTTTTNIY